MDVVACFSKLISHPSCLDIRLLCLKFHTKLILFLLNYSYLFWGPLFYGTQCILHVHRVSKKVAHRTLEIFSRTVDRLQKFQRLQSESEIISEHKDVINVLNF